MGLTISRKALLRRLERAIQIAESGADLPPEWLDRTRRMGECPSRTYIAALGTALLAKATDDSVDALTIKKKAGPRGYSMRGVVAVLADRASHYGYHLGVTGPEPLNNQPWFGADRIDRFKNIRADVVPFQQDIVRYLRDLNHLSTDEALSALAAFLRIRLDVARALTEQAQALAAETGDEFGGVLDLLEVFVNQAPEGGRRGQALMAALLDLIYDDVKLAAINDPTGLDIAVRRNGETIMAVEVKQKPVGEQAAIHLAEHASELASDKALLAALAPDQAPVDREVVRGEAAALHGVLTVVVESVREAFEQAVLYSDLSAAEAAAELPSLYLRRMQEHEVSAEGQAYWVDLCASLAPERAE
jgi:hypothetical protein